MENRIFPSAAKVSMGRHHPEETFKLSRKALPNSFIIEVQ
jgi:hypothetical protein